MPVLPRPFSNQSASEWIVQFQQADAAEERLRALQAVGSLCPPNEAGRWAAQALRDLDSTVRALGAKITGSIAIPLSHETEAQLTSLMIDADPDVRFESARALIRQKSPQTNLAAQALLAFLDETETQALMVAAVVNSLAEADLSRDLTNVELRPRIQRLLEHERAEVREAVANAFARWPEMSVSCTDQLKPLLDDNEPIVREKIAYTLGQAGIINDGIRTALEAASQDEDVDVARAATNALQLLTGKSKP